MGGRGGGGTEGGEEHGRKMGGRGGIGEHKENDRRDTWEKKVGEIAYKNVFSFFFRKIVPSSHIKIMTAFSPVNEKNYSDYELFLTMSTFP